MKRLLTIFLLLFLFCHATAAVAGSAGFPDLPDRLPVGYKSVLRNGGGTVEKITYPSKDYTGNGAEVMKKAVVYLPAGYSEAQQYDLLVLCHGVGGTENEWGFLKAGSVGKNTVDHLIANGEIPPPIIVMPNGRSTANYAATGYGNMQSFYTFGQEIRNDLLPWMDAHYATYGSLTPGDLSAARDHRYMAGLSMGGMQTINIGLCECLDLFSAFGAFSAAPTSYPASRIAVEISRFEDCPVRMFYSLCGAQDAIAYDAASKAAKNLPDYTDRLTKENWIWQECPGSHNFSVWNLGLFNFLRIMGSGEV